MRVLDLAFSLPDPAHWRALAEHSSLSLLLDLDGTLIELAPTLEEARLHPDAAVALRAVINSGVHVVFVSGRPRAAVEPLLEHAPGAWWFAEHGAWQYLRGSWTGSSMATELDDLTATLSGLTSVPGARFERKSRSVCLHWRSVAGPAKPALEAAAELATDEWLEAHEDFERLHGIEHIEVRQRGITKAIAVRKVREHLASARIIAIGDDVTDEDMFAELVPGDAAIAVGQHCSRSQAHAAVAGPSAVRELLHWIAACRTGTAVGAPPVGPIMDLRPARERSLVVISNRTPTTVVGRQREVGGLVSALEPAIRDARGIWLGWSGHERESISSVGSSLVIDALAEPARASFDLPRQWRERFYSGFCNRVLWPLFHSFAMRVSYNDDDWDAYVAANDAYAQHALDLARTDATIWVHDYHLLLVAPALRRRGHRGPVGLFLHIPFPPRELFETLPWQSELLDALLQLDMIGFHTEAWANNFLDVCRHTPGVHVDGSRVRRGAATTTVGVFPIAIDPTAFEVEGEEASDIAGLRTLLGERMLMLGVDRLDYAKGIPERLAGFERLLDNYPEWRGRVCFVQVSVPSRAEIPDYAELRQRVETMVGRINGKFGEADWVPVRYLYRSYDQSVLAQLYKLANVAVVTPLRDGMNLVAKEFVAAQDAAAPGVLVLSQFAGAAAQLTDAVLTNPLHPDGLAADLDRALRMPLAERVNRQARMHQVIRAESPRAWATQFLKALAAAAGDRRRIAETLSVRDLMPAEDEQLS